MYLAHLSLINFRNYRQLDVDLPAGAVVLYGNNAQGKTNLLEAIYLLSIAKSFRAQNERELVSREAACALGQAMVSGAFVRRDGRLRVSIGFQVVPRQEMELEFVVRKQVRVNGVPRTAAELVGLANAVLFSAQDVELVFGAPALRRRYLDILISQVDSQYLRALQRYQRVLYQRNQLLKSLREGRAGEDETVFWDAEVAREGALIILRRLQALEALAPLVERAHAGLAEGETLRVEYAASLPDVRQGMDAESVAGELSAALEAGKARERAIGATLVGPHRDDLRLTIDGLDAGTYASRGQARTVGLSLRLAEASYLAESRHEAPVLLLDDVLSELDAPRRRQVLERAIAHEQALITTTDLSSIAPQVLERASRYTVSAGTIVHDGGE